jgi:F-type H+-transporting ATPase subunit b
MALEAEFWVAVAFFILLSTLGYFGLHRRILDALDRRVARIKGEFDEAALTRQEAEALLKEAQGRHQKAAAEATTVMELARAQAAQLTAEAKAKADEFVIRRTRQAEERIVLAEAQALAKVRAAAADAAVATASDLLTTVLNGRATSHLLARDIARLKDQLCGGRS